MDEYVWESKIKTISRCKDWARVLGYVLIAAFGSIGLLTVIVLLVGDGYDAVLHLIDVASKLASIILVVAALLGVSEWKRQLEHKKVLDSVWKGLQAIKEVQRCYINWSVCVGISRENRPAGFVVLEIEAWQVLSDSIRVLTKAFADIDICADSEEHDESKRSPEFTGSWLWVGKAMSISSDIAQRRRCYMDPNSCVEGGHLQSDNDGRRYDVIAKALEDSHDELRRIERRYS